MKYTRIHIGLFVLLSGLLGASCSEDAAREYSFGESIPLGVEGLNLEATSATRAGGTLVTTEGGTIGVFLTGEGGYTPMYDKTYTYAGGGWSSTDPVYVDKRTGKVVAVYDPKGLVSFGVNSTLTTNALQAQAYSEDQLWYYDNTSGTGVNSTNAASTFSMKCAYSRIKLSITRRVYTGNCEIAKVNIKNGNAFCINRTLDISNDTYGGSATADGWNYILNSGNIIEGTTNTSYDVIVPPQQVDAGLTITLTIDGSDRAVTVPAGSFNSNLSAGRQYTISLAITATTLTISDSVIEQEWSTAFDMGTIIDSSAT